MLRAERGAGGAGAERDLDDEEIPCGLEDGDPTGGHASNPANNANDQRDYLKDWFNGCWCCAMAGWEGVTGVSSRV